MELTLITGSEGGMWIFFCLFAARCVELSWILILWASTESWMKPCCTPTLTFGNFWQMQTSHTQFRMFTLLALHYHHIRSWILSLTFPAACRSRRVSLCRATASGDLSGQSRNVWIWMGHSQTVLASHRPVPARAAELRMPDPRRRGDETRRKNCLM